MPIREYRAVDPEKCCKQCKAGFEQVEPMDAPASTACPECGNRIERQISASSVGGSNSGFDDRAKSAGFQKLEKLGHGEYEKKY
jgi:putative FmdB family regulatory protein